MDEQIAAWVTRSTKEQGKDEKLGDSSTIAQLLTHTSGLIADNALKDYQDGRAKALAPSRPCLTRNACAAT